MVFSCGRLVVEMLVALFVGLRMEMVFWDCTFHQVVHTRELPLVLPQMERVRSFWPGCLLWHGWLPGLGTGVDVPSRLSPLVTWPLERSNLFWVLTQLMFPTCCFFRMVEMRMIWLLRLMINRACGLMEVLRLIILLMSRLLGRCVCAGHGESALHGSTWGVSEHYGDAHLEVSGVHGGPWSSSIGSGG